MFKGKKKRAAVSSSRNDLAFKRRYSKKTGRKKHSYINPTPVFCADCLRSFPSLLLNRVPLRLLRYCSFCFYRYIVPFRHLSVFHFYCPLYLFISVSNWFQSFIVPASMATFGAATTANPNPNKSIEVISLFLFSVSFNS